MRNSIINLIIVLSSFLFCINIFAQTSSLVDRIVEVQTKEKNPGIARQILMNEASEKVSEELIKEIIGEPKFIKNKSLISSKILKKSASYLPFIKAGELKPLEQEGFSMNLTVKANLDQLQSLLLENGLFYDSDSSLALLPVIEWQDQVQSQSFSWWHGSKDEKVFLSKSAQAFENSLEAAFLKTGFYLLKAQSFQYNEMLVSSEKVENPTFDILTKWASLFKARVVVRGQVILGSGSRRDSYLITFKLSAIQVANNRVLSEIVRKYETDAGPLEFVMDRKLTEVLPAISSDLSGQIFDAWKQGTINSQLYKLKILGRMTIPQQEKIKESIKLQVREIKSIKERLISEDVTVYEIESSISPVDIAKKLKEISGNNLSIVLQNADEQEVIYKVKAQ